MRRRDFVPSPTPPEEYDGDSDREWSVAGVVGQSIDTFGVERFEVQWGDGWQRKDGTNTTWEQLGSSDTVDSLIRRWKRKQERKRLAAAERFRGVAVGISKHQMLHEDRTTYELVRGEQELRRLHPGVEAMPFEIDGPLKRIGPSASSVGEGGSARARDKSRSRSLEVPWPEPPQPQRQVRPIPRRANMARARSSPDVSDSDPLVAAPPPPPPQRLKLTREALQRQWAAKLRGSASVTFVNDVNAEEIPSLVSGFQYIERSYVRAPDVPANDHLADILVSCECGECVDAEECGCQDPSELTDGVGNKVFAYSKRGLFNFNLPSGTEAIECNASCSCDDQCPNRVAQLPRDVPIEVFRTRERGWGARATTALPRGKVVGIYTGQLIRREEAGRRYDERKSYIFDLDVRESAEDEDEDETEKFSVDGHAYGNWTRFVNHSCEPNMKVYPVVWDTIPELNQPYLAFVATQDIPARTELSIDYDPKAGEEARTAKQKGRQAVPDGARECRCGTESCRGWVRV